MTETTGEKPFNPKPDTAEGVGEILNQALRFVDQNGCKVAIESLEAEDGVKALFVVNGDSVTPIPDSAFDHNRDAPRFRKGMATLFDLDSFIEHVNRFKDDDSVVFANNKRENPSLTSVLDYHRSGASSAPRWGRHRGHFAFPLSDEWKAWNEYNAKPMEMATFSRFLEDHITDVLPTSMLTLNEQQDEFVRLRGGMSRIAEPAKLMEIATGLRVFEEVDTVSAYKSETGETKMLFENRQSGGESGELKVPSMFGIGIPVFVNGDPYQVLVQLRYRPVGGKVVFFYELWREDRVFDHAFDEAASRVAEDTGLPILLGTPE
jgi:uncharacterized protein YfdQ (DUF2303 family)